MSDSAERSDDLRLLAVADEQRRQEKRLGELAEGLGSLSEAVSGGVDDAAAPPAVPWWPSLDRDERARRWRQLIRWLNDELLPRHSELGLSLAECWYLHPPVVDELTMLWATWEAAYDSVRASPIGVAEWLDRWLPNAKKRIEDQQKDCRKSGHHERTDTRNKNRKGDELPARSEAYEFPGGLPKEEAGPIDLA